MKAASKKKKPKPQATGYVTRWPGPIFQPGARVYLDGTDVAVVREAFPEGSSSFLFPHYKVDILRGDRNVAIHMSRVGVDRKENPKGARREKHDPEIIEGMARGNWADYWARKREEKGESFSQMDIYELAPKTSPLALAWARRAAGDVVQMNAGRSLDALYEQATALGYPHDKERFGIDLGLQIAGHGVSYTDRLPSSSWRQAREAIKLPHREFYL
jgi:hypothetical protein